MDRAKVRIVLGTEFEAEHGFISITEMQMGLLRPDAIDAGHWNSALTWLVEQQGHTLDELKRVVASYPLAGFESFAARYGPFLSTMAAELHHFTDIAGGVTVLAELAPGEVAKLQRPGVALAVPEGAAIGISGPWQGGSSPMGVKLEKPLVIPSSMCFNIREEMEAAMNGPFESLATSTEYRSGVLWHVTYEKEAGLDEPLAGYVADESGNTLMEIVLDSSSGGYELDIKGVVRERFETFDEAMDFANEFVQSLPSQEFEKYPVHELTGRDGVYSLGQQDGKEYIINAFWSDADPGYINVNVFSLGENDQLETIASAFYNGYLSIDDCVRSLAEQFTPLEQPDIRLVADCSCEFDTPEELRQAIEEGRVEGGPIKLSDLAKEQDGRANQKPLNALMEEAKEKAAEKNAGRIAPGKERKSPGAER